MLLGCPSLPVAVRALGLVLLGLSLLQKVVGLAGCPRLLEQVVRLLAGVSVPVVGSRLCSRLLHKLVELVGCWRLLEQASAAGGVVAAVASRAGGGGWLPVVAGGNGGGGGWREAAGAAACWPEAAGASRSPATAFYYMIIGSSHSIM